jgi:hypothetical protein
VQTNSSASTTQVPTTASFSSSRSKEVEYPSMRGEVGLRRPKVSPGWAPSGRRQRAFISTLEPTPTSSVFEVIVTSVIASSTAPAATAPAAGSTAPSTMSKNDVTAATTRRRVR